MLYQKQNNIVTIYENFFFNLQDTVGHSLVEFPDLNNFWILRIEIFTIKDAIVISS